jgi:hypothetical protein
MKPAETVIQELVETLVQVERFGLTFERGGCYISAAFVEEQTELRARINAAIRAAAPHMPTLPMDAE